MNVIRTPSDLRRVLDDDSLPADLRETVEAWYFALWRTVGGGDFESFSLNPTGPIAILTEGDRPEDLPGGGAKLTEWADLVILDGQPHYDVGLLEGNSRCWRLLGRSGRLHPAVEAYLEKETACNREE